jgi:TRAP-type C4-dicarboxylate transport system permease small subunit
MLFLPQGPPGPAPVRWLTSLVDLSIVLVGTIMVALVSTNVLIHVMSFDIAWTTELCEFMMTWVTFLGGAAAARRGVHMTITEFVDKLSEPRRFAADAVIQVFCAAVLSVCVFYGISIVNHNWGNQMTVLHWPMAVQYLALPVGCGLTLAFILFDLFQILRRVPRDVRYGEGE